MVKVRFIGGKLDGVEGDLVAVRQGSSEHLIAVKRQDIVAAHTKGLPFCLAHEMAELTNESISRNMVMFRQRAEDEFKRFEKEFPGRVPMIVNPWHDDFMFVGKE